MSEFQKEKKMTSSLERAGGRFTNIFCEHLQLRSVLWNCLDDIPAHMLNISKHFLLTVIIKSSRIQSTNYLSDY